MKYCRFKTYEEGFMHSKKKNNKNLDFKKADDTQKEIKNRVKNGVGLYADGYKDYSVDDALKYARAYLIKKYGQQGANEYIKSHYKNEYDILRDTKLMTAIREWMYKGG